jgi:HSP20 family protein
MNCETKNGCEADTATNVARATPACDVWQAEDGVHVLAEMPGADPKSVEVTVAGDVLSIRGLAELPRPSGRAEGRPATIAVEYRRSFQLTDTADANAIEASCKDGLVRVRVPRKQPVQRKIAVSVG